MRELRLEPLIATTPGKVAYASETPLEPGMVLCVETPYYELGLGSLQVEDTIVVREGGAETFMALAPELRVFVR